MATLVLDEIVRQTNRHTREAVEHMLAGDAEKAFAALDAGGGRIVEQPDTQTRQAILARDFAALTAKERAATLVLDPTREGRRQLTACIRAALVRDGTLCEEALVATVLEPRGLTRAEAKRATSYQPGDVVTFREQEKGRPRPGTGYRVDAETAPCGSCRPTASRTTGSRRAGARPTPKPSPRSRWRSALATASSSPATTTAPDASTGTPPRW